MVRCNGRNTLFGFVLFASVVFGACTDESLCEQQIEFEADECGIVLTDPNASCSDPALACHYKCMEGASCDERRDIYFNDGELSYERWRCFYSCAEGVACDGHNADNFIRRCDGFVECLDGIDEEGCNYFVCEDGQYVSSYALCDGYSHCADGSDEANCGEGW